MINLLRDQEKLEKSLAEARTNVTTNDVIETKRITRSVYTPAPLICKDITANNGLPFPSSHSLKYKNTEFTPFSQSEVL
ncbi:hypothetical protein N7G274_004920 [Stereocaulon virgatum]|uniref:Uncharacterized protein n=1 Tax=Stereocaulon virgatum TaxID=373712 RepID=A0ABR4AGB2_9LECA